MIPSTGASSNRLFAPFLKLLRFWGVDRAVAYTLLARGWIIITGPINLLCIAVFLSSEEQGFYYTFAGVMAMQIFFELGLGYVLLQYASYEKVHLHWTPQRTLEGDAHAKRRLASLLYRSMIWYGIAALLLIALLWPGGSIFLVAIPSCPR